ncbi:hypothetical protein NIES4071_53770 [Calothrix sp. NIES-4071]|nr:hypothetical protein NIES4071_53770 [Calothrix sp. NIES-4071]BAZ59685.1 hypothetical protein NIES4105_53720 [Calothrix sp. NIES-4105]
MKVKAERDEAKQSLIAEGLLLLFGVLVTVATYALASAIGGGFFLVTKGILLLGFLSIYSGIWNFFKSYFIS